MPLPTSEQSAFFLPFSDKPYLSGFAIYWNIAAASAIVTTPSQFASPYLTSSGIVGSCGFAVVVTGFIVDFVVVVTGFVVVQLAL